MDKLQTYFFVDEGNKPYKYVVYNHNFANGKGVRLSYKRKYKAIAAAEAWAKVNKCEVIAGRPS